MCNKIYQYNIKTMMYISKLVNVYFTIKNNSCFVKKKKINKKCLTTFYVMVIISHI